MAAILDGMPDPKDLRVQAHGGTTYVMAGPVLLGCYRDGDLAMRNIVVAVAPQLGFPGKVVAEVMGLTHNYVATLHQRALREGAAGLARPSGPKPKLGPANWSKARKWREAGAGEAEIAAGSGWPSARSPAPGRRPAAAARRRGARAAGRPDRAARRPRPAGGAGRRACSAAGSWAGG